MTRFCVRSYKFPCNPSASDHSLVDSGSFHQPDLVGMGNDNKATARFILVRHQLDFINASARTIPFPLIQAYYRGPFLSQPFSPLMFVINQSLQTT